MIITFCGHANFSFNNMVKQKLKEVIFEKIEENHACKFYLGGYGNFDMLCLNILREFKKDFPKIEILFITPYIDNNYSKLQTAKFYYDDVIYPPIENVPQKFCILKRNEWMISQADLVIAYVKYSFGGAAKTMEFAKRKKIVFYNLAEFY